MAQCWRPKWFRLRYDKRTILTYMEHAPAAAIVDARGIVTGWSKGARRLTGYPTEDAVGRAARDLLAEEPPPAALAALTGSVVLRHRDGSPVTVALTASAVLGADGAPSGYLITAAPPGESTLAGQAFQKASLSLSVFDTDQRYLRLNDASCQVMGVPAETPLGRYFMDTVQDVGYNRGFLRHLEQVVETGRPVRYESYAPAPSSNREHAWTTQMWPVRDPDGNVIGTGMAAYDSTEQYWARQRLALLNEAAGSSGSTGSSGRRKARRCPTRTLHCAASPTAPSPRAPRKRPCTWALSTSIPRSRRPHWKEQPGIDEVTPGPERVIRPGNSRVGQVGEVDLRGPAACRRRLARSARRRYGPPKKCARGCRSRQALYDAGVRARLQHERRRPCPRSAYTT